MIILLEWVGAFAGIAGAIIMASRQPWSGWAYPLWLVSSLSLAAFGVLKGYYGLTMLQVVFTAINIFGIYRWLIAGRIPLREPRKRAQKWVINES